MNLMVFRKGELMGSVMDDISSVGGNILDADINGFSQVTIGFEKADDVAWWYNVDKINVGDIIEISFEGLTTFMIVTEKVDFGNEYAITGTSQYEIVSNMFVRSK